MKKLTTLLCLLFALCAFPTFAQHVRVDVDMDQRSNSRPVQRYRVGDIVQIGGELGIVFAVTTDGQHGKAMSTSQTQMSWDDAKAWCAQLGRGWRLPSRDELRVIRNKKSELNTHLEANGYTRIADAWHWTSESIGSDCAWPVGMNYGDPYGYDKFINYSVRAVSAF